MVLVPAAVVDRSCSAKACGSRPTLHLHPAASDDVAKQHTHRGSMESSKLRPLLQ